MLVGFIEKDIIICLLEDLFRKNYPTDRARFVGDSILY